jgi:hypothetical protein
MDSSGFVLSPQCKKTYFSQALRFSFFALCGYTKTMHLWSTIWFTLEMRRIYGESPITKGLKFADGTLFTVVSTEDCGISMG